MPTITVKVKDTQGRPVFAAPITIGGIPGSTNPSGIARINVPRSGEMRVTVHSATHKPYSQMHSFPPNDIEITLEQARF